MSHKGILSLPILLAMASCVPPTLARYASGASSPPRTEAVLAGARLAPLPSAAAIAPGQAAEPFVVGKRSERDIAASLICLTAAVYYEARSETSEGQRAVAQVVLNRVRHPAFPKSVCGVVYQGSRRSTGCQFSFTCDGSLGGRRDPAAWARARRVAGAALAGSVYGPVGHATHYHTATIRPWWAAALKRAVSVDSHIFYRWHGRWGDPKSFRRPYLAAEVGAPAPVERQAGRADIGAERTFGVTVHRGAVPPHFVPQEGEEMERSASAAGVRVHVGTPVASMPPDGEVDAIPLR